MDDNLEIGRIGFNNEGNPTVKEPIIIKLSTYKNAKYLDIRKYYEKNKEWLPTTKGITLQLDQITSLVEIITENKKKIEEWFNKN